MIRIFKLRWILLAIFMLQLLFIVFVIQSTRTTPHGLPDLHRYASGQHFDIRSCQVYTQIPYQHVYAVSGEPGYCTVDKYAVNTGIRAIQLSLAGDTIMSATVWLMPGYSIVDFMNSLGRPVKYSQWLHAFQMTWPTVILNASHLNSGSVDNVHINYIYMH